MGQIYFLKTKLHAFQSRQSSEKVKQSRSEKGWLSDYSFLLTPALLPGSTFLHEARPERLCFQIYSLIFSFAY